MHRKDLKAVGVDVKQHVQVIVFSFFLSYFFAFFFFFS